MAVGAGLDLLHDHAAARLVEIAQSPLDQANRLGGQGLDHTFGALVGHQRHVAIEDGGPGWVSGSLNSYLAARHRLFRVLVAKALAKANDGDGRRRFDGTSLYRRPRLGIRRPCMRGGLLRGQLGKFVVVRNSFRIDFPDLHPLAGRFRAHAGRPVREGDVDRPCRGICGGVAPEKSGRGDFGRKDGAIGGIIDGDGRRVAGQLLGSECPQ